MTSGHRPAPDPGCAARPFTFRPMDETAARAILGWRYDPPYDVYNPGSADTEGAVRAFLDPHNAYYGLYDDRETLVAYCCFGPDARVPGGDYSDEALDVGLGVRPDLTDKGRGPIFVRTVLNFGRLTWAPLTWRVTIAAFNARAQRVWAGAGFRPVHTFQRNGDGSPFVILVRQV